MFGLFKKDEIKEMIENAKKDAEVPEVPAPIDDQSTHDNVRVGVTNDGRIDIYGEGLYPDEIGLPPMKSEDWGRFSNWLDTFETDYMWTLRMLVSEYEKTNPKIQWHHTPEWEMYNDKESE